MRRRSQSSAGAIYLDKARRIEELRQAAERAHSRWPSIQRMILFGSLVAGTPTPRSDADILIVVETSEHARAADRVPELLRALSPLPCPVDLFVVTTEELGQARHDRDPLTREALENGVDLL